VGVQGGKAIEAMVRNSSNKSSGAIASVVGFLTLLLGATSVVGELRNAMNKVWKVPEKKDAGVADYVIERSWALVLVLGTGFLLLVSLVVSAAITAAGKFVGSMLPMPAFVLQALNILVSIVFITGLFAAMFKALPRISLKWSDVLLGAFFTALLFSVGKYLIGLYLGKASIGSTFGAAGSVVVVLVWVYYSSQIFLFGAEFTHAYAGLHGSDVKRQTAKARPKPDETGTWMAYGSPSVTAASPLPPILPIEMKKPQPSFGANVGVIAADTVALVKTFYRAFKKSETAHAE
jgi:membrane protein